MDTKSQSYVTKGAYMKLYESMVTHARPRDIRPDSIFTEKVMSKIQSKQSRKFTISHYLRTMHKNPVMAALTIIVGASVVAGVAYAVVQLWPHANVSLTGVDQKDGRTVLSVYADNCGVNKEKHFGVMTGSKITPEQAPLIVAADCNMQVISDWVQKAYPEVAQANGAIGKALPNKPGNVARDVLMPASPLAARVTAISQESITIQQQGSTPETYPITSDTSFIVGHNYAEASKLKVGDAVALLVSTKETLKADLSCTEQSCHYSFVDGERKNSLLMVATLDQPLEYYQSNLRAQIYELTSCMGNPSDECTDDGSAVELYTQFQTEDVRVPHGNAKGSSLPDGYEPAQIQGKLTAWGAASFTIKTSSGRIVTVKATTDLVDSYNTQRAYQFGYTISLGDTISLRYVHPKGVVNDETISSTLVDTVQLKVATLGKGDQNFKKF